MRYLSVCWSLRSRGRVTSYSVYNHNELWTRRYKQYKQNRHHKEYYDSSVNPSFSRCICLPTPTQDTTHTTQDVQCVVRKFQVNCTPHSSVCSNDNILYFEHKEKNNSTACKAGFQPTLLFTIRTT